VRATRAFLASLGASLSLVVAGSLALMTVSTVVAFRGWPGIGSAPAVTDAGALVAATSDRDAARAKDRDAIVVPRRATFQRAASKPQAKQTASRATTSARVTPTAPTATKVQTRPATVAQAGAATGKSAAAPQPKAEPKAGDPVRKVGSDLGDKVQTTGQQLNGLLDNVSPALGNVVEDVSNLVAGVVGGTSEVLGKVLDALTKPRHQ